MAMKKLLTIILSPFLLSRMIRILYRYLVELHVEVLNLALYSCTIV